MKQALILALTIVLSLVTASASAKIAGGGGSLKSQMKPSPAVTRAQLLDMIDETLSQRPMELRWLKFRSSRKDDRSTPSWDELLKAKEEAAYRMGLQERTRDLQRQMERGNDRLWRFIGMLGITLGGILMAIFIFIMKAMRMANAFAHQDEDRG